MTKLKAIQRQTHLRIKKRLDQLISTYQQPRPNQDVDGNLNLKTSAFDPSTGQLKSVCKSSKAKESGLFILIMASQMRTFATAGARSDSDFVRHWPKIVLNMLIANNIPVSLVGSGVTFLAYPITVDGPVFDPSLLLKQKQVKGSLIPSHRVDTKQNFELCLGGLLLVPNSNVTFIRPSELVQNAILDSKIKSTAYASKKPSVVATSGIISKTCLALKLICNLQNQPRLEVYNILRYRATNLSF